MSAMPLRVHRVLSYDAMVEEGVGLARDGTTIRDAARVILDTCDPDPDSIETMYRVALITGINSRINTGAGAEGTGERDGSYGSGPRLTGSPGTPRHLRYQEILEHLNYEGADGVRRTLIDFTLADCAAFGARMTSLSRGAALKAKAMTLAASYLRSEGKDRIGDLPDKSQNNIGRYLTRATKAEEGKE